MYHNYYYDYYVLPTKLDIFLDNSLYYKTFHDLAVFCKYLLYTTTLVSDSTQTYIHYYMWLNKQTVVVSIMTFILYIISEHKNKNTYTILLPYIIAYII